MARKFFYVCAGMLMLALSYQLGASTVVAQVPGTVDCVGFGTYSANAVIGGRLYFINNSSPSVVEDLGPLPTPGRAVACGYQGVVMEDGSVWVNNGPGNWRQLATFPFTGPVPTQRETWGQLKSRYAPSPGTPTSNTNER